jgi:hypothetical protein
VGFLTDRRVGLSTALAGADLTEAGALEAVKALPALVVGPGPSYLDGRILPTGPGRTGSMQLRATVVVQAVEPDHGQRGLEDILEAVLDRLPRHWHFDRTDEPYPVRVGELAALAAPCYFSTPINYAAST